MELQTVNPNIKPPEGYVLISIAELHKIEDMARAMESFRGTYFSYNKKLNRLFNIADEIIKVGQTQDPHKEPETRKESVP